MQSKVVAYAAKLMCQEIVDEVPETRNLKYQKYQKPETPTPVPETRDLKKNTKPETRNPKHAKHEIRN